MAQITFYKDVDSKAEFLNEVADFCKTINTVGKVKTRTEGKMTTLWYVWKERPFYVPEDQDFNSEDWGGSIALVGKIPSGDLKDWGINLNGVILTIIGNVVQE